jgi:hypothetical protein
MCKKYATASQAMKSFKCLLALVLCDEGNPFNHQGPAEAAQACHHINILNRNP